MKFYIKLYEEVTTLLEIEADNYEAAEEIVLLGTYPHEAVIEQAYDNTFIERIETSEPPQLV